jgi:thiol-disulfide isomerase/thioredoxin
MRKLSVLALLILVLLPWSCEAAGANELHQFVRGSWNDIRKAHAGKPTVIHFWGVTCGPCRIEMPNWGKLLVERPDLNLVVINADLVPNEPAAVTAMLAETGLTAAENWTFGDGFVERLRYEIDPQWRGEIPRTILIARDGSTTVIEGVADLDHVRAWLDGQSGGPKR